MGEFNAGTSDIDLNLSVQGDFKVYVIVLNGNPYF